MGLRPGRTSHNEGRTLDFTLLVIGTVKKKNKAVTGSQRLASVKKKKETCGGKTKTEGIFMTADQKK